MNRKRLIELEKLLTDANEAYYNKAESIIPDEEYDRLKDELCNICPRHPLLTQIGQPVSTVTDWKKAKHKISMTSLNKVNTISEFMAWSSESKDNLYIAEEKLDGISIDLEYENGKLIKALTRGDGNDGEDIFSNVKQMKNVKTSLSDFSGSLRGEIVLELEDFEDINKVQTFKNPRNAACGIAKRFDGKFSKNLTILFYDIACDEHFNSESEKIKFIQTKFGLKTSPYKIGTTKEICEWYTFYEKEQRAKVTHDIDGIVVKCESLNIQEKLGMVNERPRGQIAFKFAGMKKETKIRNIDWSNGKNRRITPIANLEPVNIGGVTISNASIHNHDYFTKYDFNFGDRVMVERKNDVIPQIVEILGKGNGKKFEAPKNCPTCGSQTEVEGKFLICPNDNCNALITGNLEKWISGLEIMDIGDKIIDALHHAGKIKEPADFYKLNIPDIANIDGLGEKSAKKILEHLHQKKELTLPEFIGNLNMHNFSTSRVELLVDAGYDSIDKIQNAKIDDLVRVKGIEAKTAKDIISGLNTKKKIIENLLKVGITIKAIQKAQVKSSKLKGLSFVFTGGINRINSNGDRYTRDMMEALVIENGGEISSVKRGLSFLIQVDPNSLSSKSQKAKELGISILSEVDFFKKLGM